MRGIFLETTYLTDRPIRLDYPAMFGVPCGFTGFQRCGLDWAFLGNTVVTIRVSRLLKGMRDREKRTAMCLILHGVGHLTVKLLFEQIWPILYEGKLGFLECYDFILRSYADQDLDHLYLLSPQSAPSDRLFKLKPSDDLKVCDWAIQETPFPSSDSRRKIRIDGGPELQVTRLKPDISLPAILQPGGAPTDAGAALIISGMTFAHLTFKDGQKIRPFDPADEGGTTYWIRVAYEPKVRHRITNPIAFGPAKGPAIFRVQPCEILSPTLVLRCLEDQLTVLAQENATAPSDAKRKIIDDVFLRPGTSTRIEDHRISLITTPEFLVLSPVVEGACAIIGVQQVHSCIARKWFMGANHYPTTDPLCAARLVYRYLKEWARNRNDAKTKEAISSAIAPEQHSNISHVVEALRKLGLIEEARDQDNRYTAHYYIKDPNANANDLLQASLAGSGPLEALDVNKRCRDDLYGALPVPTPGKGFSRFEPKSAKIHFDLAFSASEVRPAKSPNGTTGIQKEM